MRAAHHQFASEATSVSIVNAPIRRRDSTGPFKYALLRGSSIRVQTVGRHDTEVSFSPSIQFSSFLYAVQCGETNQSTSSRSLGTSQRMPVRSVSRFSIASAIHPHTAFFDFPRNAFSSAASKLKIDAVRIAALSSGPPGPRCGFSTM